MQIGSWLVLALIFGAVAALAAWAGNTQRRWKVEGKLHGASFRAEPLLVNQSERSAWDFLSRADLGQAHIFAKVRLEDVVSASAADSSTRNSARGRIKSRHLDFLLTDADFRPILAVEVDGRSHRTERAATTDEMKNQILAAAGVPLLRLQVGADWNAAVAQWRREQPEKTAGALEIGKGTHARDRH